MSLLVCPNCGAISPPDSEFCPNCGETFTAKPKEKKEPAPTPRKRGDRARAPAKVEEAPVIVKKPTGEGVPYLGDSVIEGKNVGFSGNAIIGCGAASSKRFNVYFQQRNKLIVNIEESGDILEDSAMDGLRAFIYPDIVKEDYDKKDMLDLYVNTPRRDDSVPENYGLKNYPANGRLNFGYIVFAAPNLEFDDQIKIDTAAGKKTSKYVVPLLSKIAYTESLEKPMPANLYPVDMEWSEIKKKFTDNDEIKYALFARDETKFRWEHPISLKIEIEDYNVSVMKAFDSRANLERWRTPGTPMVEASRLATVRVLVTNTTYFQIFFSYLKEVDLFINFETTQKELIQPSALILPPAAEYLLDEKAINWKIADDEFGFYPGRKEILTFYMDRDILERVDGFNINISGRYETNPQMFNAYTYVSPMGFPVKISSSTVRRGKTDLDRAAVDIEWNPGTTTTGGTNLPHYNPVDCNVTDYFKEFQPAFFQEVQISKENLRKSAMQPNYVEILNKSSQFLLNIQENLRKMEGPETKKEQREVFHY
jgi:hypothetical protein